MNTYEKAIAKFGPDIQIYVATEEMGELIQALSKYLRSDNPSPQLLDNIVEEIADVTIMLNQLLCIFQENDKHFQTVFNSKLKRLSDKIDS